MMRVTENVRSKPFSGRATPFLVFKSLSVFPAKLRFCDGCSWLLLRWILTHENKSEGKDVKACPPPCEVLR